jgi:hypothetical protein
MRQLLWTRRIDAVLGRSFVGRSFGLTATYAYSKLAQMRLRAPASARR